MYAIIETGGKQLRVEEGQKIRVARIQADAGSELKIDKVLALAGEDHVFGTPYVDKASVTCEVLDHGRDRKVVVFHKWRRKDSRKKQGHRQDYTTLQVKAINK